MARAPSWRVSPVVFSQAESLSSLVLLRKLPLIRDQVLQLTDFPDEITAGQIVENARIFGLLSPRADGLALQRLTERFLDEKIPDHVIDNWSELQAVAELQWKFEEKLLKPFLQNDPTVWVKAGPDNWHALLRTINFADSRAGLVKDAAAFLRKVPWQVLLEKDVQNALENSLGQYRQRSVATDRQVLRRQESSCLHWSFARKTYNVDCEPKQSHQLYEKIEDFDFLPFSQTENLFARLLGMPNIAEQVAPLALDFAQQDGVNPLVLAQSALSDWEKRAPQDRKILEPLFARALAFEPRNEMEARVWARILSERVKHDSLFAIQVLRSLMSNTRDRRLLDLESQSHEAAELVINTAVELLSEQATESVEEQGGLSSLFFAPFQLMHHAASALDPKAKQAELAAFRSDMVELLRGESEQAKFLVQSAFLGKKAYQLYLQLEQAEQARLEAAGLGYAGPDFRNLRRWVQAASPENFSTFFQVLNELAGFSEKIDPASLPWQAGTVKERMQELAQDGRWYSLQVLDLLAAQVEFKLNNLDEQITLADDPQLQAELRFFENYLRPSSLRDAARDMRVRQGRKVASSDFSVLASLLQHAAVPALLAAVESLMLSEDAEAASMLLSALSEQVVLGRNGQKPLEILFRVFASENSLAPRAQKELQLLLNAAREEPPLASTAQRVRMEQLRFGISSRLKSLMTTAKPKLALTSFDLFSSTDCTHAKACPKTYQELQQFDPRRFMQFYKKNLEKERALAALEILLSFGNERAYRAILSDWLTEPSRDMFSPLKAVLGASETDPRHKWREETLRAFARVLRDFPDHELASNVFNVLLEYASKNSAAAVQALEQQVLEEGPFAEQSLSFFLSRPDLTPFQSSALWRIEQHFVDQLQAAQEKIPAEIERVLNLDEHGHFSFLREQADLMLEEFEKAKSLRLSLKVASLLDGEKEELEQQYVWNIIEQLDILLESSANVQLGLSQLMQIVLDQHQPLDLRLYALNQIIEFSQRGGLQATISLQFLQGQLESMTDPGAQELLELISNELA